MTEVPPANDGLEFHTIGRLQIRHNEYRNDAGIPLQGSAQPSRPVWRGQDPSKARACHPDIGVKGGATVMLRGYCTRPDLDVSCSFHLRGRKEILRAQKVGAEQSECNRAEYELQSPSAGVRLTLDAVAGNLGCDPLAERLQQFHLPKPAVFA